MLKVVKGDRPDRPPSGLSETLWNLLAVIWAEQYAQKPRNRPLASTLVTQLRECVGDWGKSILPLVPEDWDNTGLCHMFPNGGDSSFMSLSQIQTTMMTTRILRSRQVTFST